MSQWSPEEQLFLDRIRANRSLEESERQRRDVLRRCHETLSERLKGFSGARSTELNQQIINNVARRVIQQFQQELEERGIDYEIKLELSF